MMDAKLETGVVVLRVECSACDAYGVKNDPHVREFDVWLELCDELLGPASLADPQRAWRAFLAAKDVEWYEFPTRENSPCGACGGTGHLDKLVTLSQLKRLLDRPIPF